MILRAREPRTQNGQMLRHHQEQNIPVHPFVRQSKKIGSESDPFYYCGPVTIEQWDGEKPITIQWHLNSPVPEHLRSLFLIGVRETEVLRWNLSRKRWTRGSCEERSHDQLPPTPIDPTGRGRQDRDPVVRTQRKL